MLRRKHKTWHVQQGIYTNQRLAYLEVTENVIECSNASDKSVKYFVVQGEFDITYVTCYDFSSSTAAEGFLDLNHVRIIPNKQTLSVR